MTDSTARAPMPQDDVCERALNARDPRFDGIFFVGITTTGIYCRPVCPARVSYTNRRRFFPSAASAEHAGYRPCLRCRPELAPGRSVIGAVSRLAWVAAHRIGAGALNGRGVACLASELGVSERHLRRALEREIGVSPIELAQTHRLLLAKRLLADTSLSVTRIAFASGFQSLRRFNSVFRERYRLSPSALRRPARSSGRPRDGGEGHAPSRVAPNDLVRLTLAYRAPLAWDVLTGYFGRHAIPGVEVVDGGFYGRTINLEGRSGFVLVNDAAQGGRGARGGRTHLTVDVSSSLLPVLMPLLARLRQLFDLDAEPNMVDAHLRQEGLERLIRRHPGVRIPGAFDGFEVALQDLLSDPAGVLLRRVVAALGQGIETGIPALNVIAPSAAQVATSGVSRLSALGVPTGQAHVIASVAEAVVEGRLQLQPGCDVAGAHRALMHIDGMEERLATTIVMRALYWPDAFPTSDPGLLQATGSTNPQELRARAERWRPWRAYAALHLWMNEGPVDTEVLNPHHQ